MKDKDKKVHLANFIIMCVFVFAMLAISTISLVSIGVVLIFGWVALIFTCVLFSLGMVSFLNKNYYIKLILSVTIAVMAIFPLAYSSYVFIEGIRNGSYDLSLIAAVPLLLSIPVIALNICLSINLYKNTLDIKAKAFKISNLILTIIVSVPVIITSIYALTLPAPEAKTLHILSIPLFIIILALEIPAFILKEGKATFILRILLSCLSLLANLSFGFGMVSYFLYFAYVPIYIVLATPVIVGAMIINGFNVALSISNKKELIQNQKINTKENNPDISSENIVSNDSTEIEENLV